MFTKSVSDDTGNCYRISNREDGVEMIISESLPSEESLAPIFSDVWTGSQIWDASVALCSFLSSFRRHHNEDGDKFFAEDSVVIELGSGCGLAGIYASKLGAKVLLTDQSQLVPLLQYNIAKNIPASESKTPGRVRAAALSWGDRLPKECDIFRPVNYILVSDCINPIYGMDSWRKLADTTRQLSNLQTITYMSHQKRGEDEAFLDFCDYIQSHFAIKQVWMDGLLYIHEIRLISF